jgi:hypothetical protein
MNLRQAGWLVIKVVAGVLSASVSLHAIYAAIAVDFRFNPVLTLLYCLFPGLSFLVFLFVRSARTEAFMQTALFLGYLVTASMLGWRNCSAYGYCASVTSVIAAQLQSKTIAVSLAVASLSIVAWLIGSTRQSASPTVK